MATETTNPITETEKNVIVLNKLQIVTKESGMISHSPVKIEAPTPCAQANSSGTLSQATLEDFRNNARSIGAAFRAALGNA